MNDQTIRSPDNRARDTRSLRTPIVNVGSYICDVCKKPIIDADSVVWIDSYAPECQPQTVPAHENCRHSTCRNMIEPKEQGQ